MAVTNNGWSAILTLSLLGLIPFAALSFFIAIYFGSIRRAQIMKQQNVIVSPDQQIWIRDDKKKKSSVSNIQSANHKRTISRVKHCDAQIDTNRTFSITELGISGGFELELFQRIRSEIKRMTITFSITKLREPSERRSSINEFGNTILKDTRPKINDETAVNSNMQLQSSCSSIIHRDAPTISSIIVVEGERTTRDTSRNQSSYQITYVTQALMRLEIMKLAKISTPITRNLILTPKTPLTSSRDKASIQKILNNSSCEFIASHRITKHTSLQRTSVFFIP
ncbi:unnamed protein product [Brugia timori]|uniref:Transmembrane protein n=1 Tax=Brugia timori TaxID=42155 RepID=A0A0R3Q343_9BILA|nr:unnamed protein product [Brugia timori]